MTSTDRLVSIHADESFPTRVQAAINALITAGIIGKADATTVTTALAAKAPLASPAFTGTPTGITKTHVGLSNVDNTSDANKPVSTAQAAAITAAVSGLVNGAPGALDTLNELAAALGNDASFATTVTNALATKVNSSTYTAGLAGKADVATTVTDLPDATVSAATAQLAAGVTSNVAARGAYTSPALDVAVATPPKRWAVKANASGPCTVTYPDPTGASATITILAGGAKTFRQASTSGWKTESGTDPLTQLDSRFAAYGLAMGRGGCTVPIGVRGHAAFENSISVAVGATGAITFEQFHPLTDPTATTVLPVFGNWMAQTGWSNGDYDATQAVRISAAVKNSDSTIVPFSFNGSHTATLTPGTAPLAIPDAPVAFDKQVSANDKFGAALPLTGVWLRIRVDPIDTSRNDSVTTTTSSATVTDASITAGDAGKLVTGTGIPANTYVGTVTPGTSFTMVNAPGGSVAVNATASGTVTATITATIPANYGPLGNSDTLSAQNTTDLTLPGAGNVSGGSGTVYYGPLLLLGRSKIRKPIFALISDSILNGYSEDFHSAYFGPAARAALQLGLPFVKLSRGGETSLAWSTAIGRRYRTAMLDGCTHALVALGTNDGMLTTGNGAGGVTSMQTRLTAIGTLLNSLGIKAWLTTVPPRTTSTDAWATAGNQTAVSGSQITFLASLNDWIRTTPAPFSGYYDMADDVMSARNSGVWAAGATTDGVHPSDTLMRGTISTNVKNLVSTFTL